MSSLPRPPKTAQQREEEFFDRRVKRVPKQLEAARRKVARLELEARQLKLNL